MLNSHVHQKRGEYGDQYYTDYRARRGHPVKTGMGACVSLRGDHWAVGAVGDGLSRRQVYVLIRRVRQVPGLVTDLALGQSSSGKGKGRLPELVNESSESCSKSAS